MGTYLPVTPKTIPNLFLVCDILRMYTCGGCQTFSKNRGYQEAFFYPNMHFLLPFFVLSLKPH